MPPWKAKFEGLLYIPMVPYASYTIGSLGDEHVYGTIWYPTYVQPFE